MPNQTIGWRPSLEAARDEARQSRKGWNRLLEEFPESDWARKAEFIRG